MSRRLSNSTHPQRPTHRYCSSHGTGEPHAHTPIGIECGGPIARSLLVRVYSCFHGSDYLPPGQWASATETTKRSPTGCMIRRPPPVCLSKYLHMYTVSGDIGSACGARERIGNVSVKIRKNCIFGTENMRGVYQIPSCVNSHSIAAMIRFPPRLSVPRVLFSSLRRQLR